MFLPMCILTMPLEMPTDVMPQTWGIKEYVKECAMGFLMKRELNYFNGALEIP
jgi:hypothetical protein